MSLIILYTLVTVFTSAAVGVGGFLIGCWCGHDQCRRKALEQQRLKQLTQSQPLVEQRSNTGILADVGRDYLKWKRFNDMVHDKGVRRDGGSGDLL